MSEFVYVLSDRNPDLFTVGHYSGDKWESESDHISKDKAAERCNYLNGGNAPQLQAEIDALHGKIDQLDDVTNNLIYEKEALQAKNDRLREIIGGVHRIAHEAIIRKGINTAKTMGEIIILTEQPLKEDH